MNKQEIISMLQQISLDNDIVRQIEQALLKAEKWDKLDAEIGEYYAEEIDFEDEDTGSLLEIGETAAIAFGYL